MSFAYICSALAAIALPTAISQGTWSAFVFLCLLGLSLGGVILLAWSSFSEQIADWGMAKDPVAAARAYGWFTATAKIGLGLSGLMTGTWLSQGNGRTIWALWLLVVPVATLCLASGFMAWIGWSFKGMPQWRKWKPT